MAESENIALITGANKGIGFEIARQLASKGFRVFVGARNEKAGRAAGQKIGATATFLKIDVSKTALNGVTTQLAAALPKFAVNSVCPGWVRTDMGGATAPRSVEQGADGIVWLAADAPQNLTGKFLQDRKVIPW